MVILLPLLLFHKNISEMQYPQYGEEGSCWEHSLKRRGVMHERLGWTKVQDFWVKNLVKIEYRACLLKVLHLCVFMMLSAFCLQEQSFLFTSLAFMMT